jgi:hypothetical protein
VIAALLIILTAVVAQAEDLSIEDSRLVMRDLANCMASHHGRDARAFLELDPSVPLGSEQAQLVHGDCMPIVASDAVPVLAGARTPSIAMKGTTTQYQYALAEALLLRTYRRTTPTIPTDAPPLSHPSLAADAPLPSSWTRNSSEWTAQIQHSQHDALAGAFGECVVRASPDLSLALLRTVVGSGAEGDAFGALKPTLAGCLGKVHGMPSGKFGVRGTIALNFYRLAIKSGVPRRREGNAE